MFNEIQFSKRTTTEPNLRKKRKKIIANQKGEEYDVKWTAKQRDNGKSTWEKRRKTLVRSTFFLINLLLNAFLFIVTKNTKRFFSRFFLNITLFIFFSIFFISGLYVSFSCLILVLLVYRRCFLQTVFGMLSSKQKKKICMIKYTRAYDKLLIGSCAQFSCWGKKITFIFFSSLRIKEKYGKLNRLARLDGNAGLIGKSLEIFHLDCWTPEKSSRISLSYKSSQHKKWNASQIKILRVSLKIL